MEGLQVMTSVKEAYDGFCIVPDEEITLKTGQQAIITLLNPLEAPVPATESLDLSRYMGRGEKMFHTDTQEHVTKLRANDA